MELGIQSIEFDTTTAFIILMIIIVSVTVFLFLGEKVKFSAISIELIIGMILGNFLFGVVPGFPNVNTILHDLFWLKFLAELGFVLLMFLAGLELNMEFLKKFFKKSMVLIICVTGITFLVGFILGFLLPIPDEAYRITIAVLIGIFFAGASLAIAFPLLQELGLSQKRLGQILITATMAIDIFCIFIITFTITPIFGGFSILTYVIVTMIIILIFIIILYGMDRFWRFFEGRTTKIKALEWELRIAFAVILLLAVFTGIFFEAIIGGFIAGMIMGQSKSANRLEEKIGSIGYGFFVPIFFFVIGMQMDLSYFTQPNFVLMMIVAIVILFAIKIGTGILSAKFMGFSWKTGLITGFIMIPSLSIGIAVAELSYNNGVGGIIDKEIFTLLIAIVVISSALAPVLTRTTAKKLIPTFISKDISWHLHLEHDLGIYLDESFHNVFEEFCIGDMVSKEVQSVTLDTPITIILEMMEKYHQMNFPVVSSDNQLLGIVDFDDAKKFILQNKLNETAGTIMRKEFIFVVPADPLSAALDKMQSLDLELLPVVEIPQLTLLGTVSRDNILRYVRVRALGASITPEDRAAAKIEQSSLEVEKKLESTVIPEPEQKTEELSEQPLPLDKYVPEPETKPKPKAKKKKPSKKKKTSKKKKPSKKKKTSKKKKSKTKKKKAKSKKKKGNPSKSS